MLKTILVLYLYVLPKIRLTKLLSHIANTSRPRWLKNFLIKWAVRHYKIDLSIAAETDLKIYKTFNHFFTRRLKVDARPLSAEDVISPVDGSISQIGYSDNGRLIQAKKIFYSLDTLLNHQLGLTATFKDSCFVTLYLGPKDYHRVHMPIRGKLLQTIYVPGALFSVSLLSQQQVANLFVRNERLICEFETKCGNMVMIFVGALFVGGIHTVWAGDIRRGKQTITTDYSIQNIWLEKGAEAGYFNFGSTIILLFTRDSIIWNQLCYVNQPIVTGQALAHFNPTKITAYQR